MGARNAVGNAVPRSYRPIFSCLPRVLSQSECGPTLLVAHQKKRGTAGIEPATAGSAIPCSTAELSTRSCVNITNAVSSRFCFFFFSNLKKNLQGPCGNWTRDLSHPKREELSAGCQISNTLEERSRASAKHCFVVKQISAFRIVHRPACMFC